MTNALTKIVGFGRTLSQEKIVVSRAGNMPDLPVIKVDFLLGDFVGCRYACVGTSDPPDDTSHLEALVTAFSDIFHAYML